VLGWHAPTALAGVDLGRYRTYAPDSRWTGAGSAADRLTCLRTSERQTGSIRATLTATRQRSLVLAVKAAVLGIVAAITGIVSAIASFLVGQAIFHPRNLQAHLTNPGAPRSVIGTGLYLVVLGLLAPRHRQPFAAALRRRASVIGHTKFTHPTPHFSRPGPDSPCSAAMPPRSRSPPR
jgi:hypothetical protein